MEMGVSTQIISRLCFDVEHSLAHAVSVLKKDSQNLKERASDLGGKIDQSIRRIKVRFHNCFAI